MSWILHKGIIPEGLHVLHTCDNRPCCNPSHLFLGTIIDNNADKQKKGRQCRGRNHGRAKFSSEFLDEIKHAIISMGKSKRGIARHFGISKTRVQDISKGLVTIFAIVFLTACTITQHNSEPVTSTVGNNVEGGFMGELGIGDSFQGYVFQKGSIDHYNALIDLYGALPQTINDQSIGFVPALKANDGIQALAPGMMLKVWHLGQPHMLKSDGLYLMDREHAKKYKRMRGWEDNGLHRQTYLRTLTQ